MALSRPRNFQTDRMQRVFAVNHIVFEPCEGEQGEDACLENVSWSPPKRA